MNCSLLHEHQTSIVHLVSPSGQRVAGSTGGLSVAPLGPRGIRVSESCAMIFNPQCHTLHVLPGTSRVALECREEHCKKNHGTLQNLTLMRLSRLESLTRLGRPQPYHANDSSGLPQGSRKGRTGADQEASDIFPMLSCDHT